MSGQDVTRDSASEASGTGSKRPRARTAIPTVIAVFGVAAAILGLVADFFGVKDKVFPPPPCSNAEIPAEVRAELSVAAEASAPAKKGTVFYGTCEGTDWALASFPGLRGERVLRRENDSWVSLGTLARERCKVPNQLMEIWRKTPC